MDIVESSDPDDDMLDVDFISSQSSAPSSQSAERGSLTIANVKVLKYINTTFHNVMLALATDVQPEIVLKRVGCSGGSSQRNSTQHDRGRSETTQSVAYRWPGRTDDEAWRFGR